jgi:hypothetical protein
VVALEKMRAAETGDAGTDDRDAGHGGERTSLGR